MDKSITAGISGFIVAIIINILSPAPLYFVPSFLAAILVIYFFKVETLKEGLVTAFMTYIFNDAILGTATLATFYISNEVYPSFNVDVWIMLSPIVSAISALIAGYIGVLFVKATKPSRALPPIPQSQVPPPT
jgi:hypothetical protein